MKIFEEHCLLAVCAKLLCMSECACVINTAVLKQEMNQFILNFVQLAKFEIPSRKIKGHYVIEHISINFFFLCNWGFIKIG